MCEYNLYLIYFLLLLHTFFPLRVSLLLPSSNDASVDVFHDESSFEFSPKAEFTSPLYVYITF